ncbi:unnamed protein product, partial [Prorocentrum cordatum]
MMSRTGTSMNVGMLRKDDAVGPPGAVPGAGGDEAAGRERAAARARHRPTAESWTHDDARWRQPLQGPFRPAPRASHTAVLESPAREGEDACVLVFGGLGEGLAPARDTYRVRITKSEDQALEAAWSCVDEGGSGRCETAPWEQQSQPRPRACHSAVFWQQGQLMVVFGGLCLGLEGEACAYGDTWLLHADSGAQGDRPAPAAWKRPLAQGGAPARRWGHGACLVAGPRLQHAGVRGRRRVGAAALGLLAAGAGGDVLARPRGEPGPPRPPPRAAAAPSGRCAASWAGPEQVAIVWGGRELWLWRGPEQPGQPGAARRGLEAPERRGIDDLLRGARAAAEEPARADAEAESPSPPPKGVGLGQLPEPPREFFGRLPQGK